MGHTCFLVSRVLLVHRSGIHLAALVFTLTTRYGYSGRTFCLSLGGVIGFKSGIDVIDKSQKQRVKPCLLEKGVLLEAGVSCWEVTFDQ